MLDSYFSGWLDSDSTKYFTFLDWLNSNSTQVLNLLTWLNSDSNHLSQNWLKLDSRLITFYPIWLSVVNWGMGVRSNVQITAKSKRFLLKKNQWLNFNSGSIQLTQLWLKWRWTWFDSDSTHILDFHGRINSDSAHLSRAQLWSRQLRCNNVLRPPSTGCAWTHSALNHRRN